MERLIRPVLKIVLVAMGVVAFAAATFASLALFAESERQKYEQYSKTTMLNMGDYYLLLREDKVRVGNYAD